MTDLQAALDGTNTLVVTQIGRLHLHNRRASHELFRTSDPGLIAELIAGLDTEQPSWDLMTLGMVEFNFLADRMTLLERVVYLGGYVRWNRHDGDAKLRHDGRVVRWLLRHVPGAESWPQLRPD